MTVCIAAICEEGKYIVVAADRMFTSPLNVEFETDEQKIEALGDSCVALAAGSSASSAEVLGAVRIAFKGKSKFSVSDVTGEAKQQYAITRSQKIEDNVIVSSLGKDLAEFRRKGFSLPQYLQQQPNVYNQIMATSQNFSITLDLLIAGIDDTGAHIYQVGHPGTIHPLDKLGHSAVGSGALHAIIYLSLVAQTTHKKLIETLYTVYDAKKAAEVAPGVGSETDIAIVEKDKIWSCPHPLLEALENVSAGSRKRTLPDLKEVEAVYEQNHV